MSDSESFQAMLTAMFYPPPPEGYSHNERAGELLGFRRTDCIVIDQPCELGYHCPVCEYELTDGKNFDERLTWSEYNAFLWCSVCNKDYPSCLCVPREQIDHAIKVFLDIIRDVKTTAP